MKIFILILALAALFIVMPAKTSAITSTTSTTTTYDQSDLYNAGQYPNYNSCNGNYTQNQNYRAAQSPCYGQKQGKHHRSGGNFFNKLLYAGVAKYLLNIPVTASLIL